MNPSSQLLYRIL